MVARLDTARLDEARSLDLALRQALAEHRSAEHRAAMLLVQMYQGRLFRQLGYISIHAYAHQVLDLPIRQSRSLLQLGRSLPELPSLDAAFAAGELGWTKARELLRVVTPDTEADWVACATACTSRLRGNGTEHAEASGCVADSRGWSVTSHVTDE